MGKFSEDASDLTVSQLKATLEARGVPFENGRLKKYYVDLYRARMPSARRKGNHAASPPRSVSLPPAVSEVGPGERSNVLRVSTGLSSMLRSHAGYLASLSLWRQYLVFRYTCGSGQVNAGLLGMPNAESSVMWVYYLFKFFGLYSPDAVEAPFSRFRPFFQQPRDFLAVQPDARRLELAKEVIAAYTRALQDIVRGAPPLQEDLVVYKATNPYPQLPKETVIAQPIDVPQIPFNSTSYDPEFNYGQFLAGETEWALLRLVVPRGSRVLSVDPSWHAYPYEREVLHPHGAVYRFYESRVVEMNYIAKEDVKYEECQPKNGPVAIGEVFRPSPDVEPAVRRRPMHLLSGVYLPPPGW